LRGKLKGWNRNVEAEMKRKKKALISEIDSWDKLAEHQPLTNDERDKRKVTWSKLNKAWSIEEIKVRQRSQEREIKEGDRNIAYFYAKANQRKRKKVVQCLEHEGSIWTRNKDMLEHALVFYKSLFGREDRDNIRLGEEFWQEGEKILPEENQLLEADFFEEEILEAIKGSYSYGAPGPDEFSFLFYQNFWPTIKNEFMALVRSFEKGELNNERINYAMLVLIPKEEGTKSLKKFRPISLLNCSFKIFTKALNNRLEKISDRLIAPNQTAFVNGRFILESVVSAHKIIHWTVRNKEKDMVLKLDYEKAYDKVCWGFLKKMLISRGFWSKWVAWIMKLVVGGSISIRLNEENSSYFSPGKGLRQGDPLPPPPLLFNLVVDIFTRIFVKVVTKGYL
jgi:hypothetical protein